MVMYWLRISRNPDFMPVPTPHYNIYNIIAGCTVHYDQC